MSNRNYSYIFSPVLPSGNISSQSLTGLYNLIAFTKDGLFPKILLLLMGFALSLLPNIMQDFWKFSYFHYVLNISATKASSNIVQNETFKG